MKPTSGCSWAVSREFYQFSQTPLTGGSSGPAPPLLGPRVFSMLHLPVSSGPAVINASCFKAGTSQIITYRCSETFMWGRRMRVRLSDSGAAEDRKPQPATRQSPGYTSLPDECVSKCNSKGICGEGSACLCRLLCSTIHLQPCVSLPTNANVPRGSGKISLSPTPLWCSLFHPTSPSRGPPSSLALSKASLVGGSVR